MRIPDNLRRAERFRSLGNKENLLILRPSGGISPTRNASVTLNFNLSFGDFVPASSVHKVEDNRRLLRCGESVAMHSHARSRSQFSEHPIAFKSYAVVSRHCHLPASVSIGPESALRSVFRASCINNLSHNRHHGDVEKVPDARSAEMCVRKTDDCGVRFVIARAPVPLLRYARRPELDHAERHIRTHKNVSVSSGSNLQIHPFREVVPKRSGTSGSDEKSRRHHHFSEYLHIFNFRK